ncbi:MAG: L-histidine N(alpha)-methyltransferase [Verrucomicrobiota bacterium]
MSRPVQIIIHPSQLPETLRSGLLDGLRSRRLNPKYLYDSPEQTRRWLALHQAHSPSRNDPACARSYERAFEAAAGRVSESRVHLVGLGCGGGRKDAGFLGKLQSAGRELYYTPLDVSVTMVLLARAAAEAVIPETGIHPVVCDLAQAPDLPSILEKLALPDAARVFTFFGMIPNFQPAVILPRLASLVRAQDLLLFSANLAPGSDYAAGVRRILPQYDNALTRDWLLAFLAEMGVDPAAGRLDFDIETDNAAAGVRRVVADFRFGSACALPAGEDAVPFAAGDVLRLFFSYRYTPDRIADLLAREGLCVLDRWIAASGEEGVFLVGRARNGS